MRHGGRDNGFDTIRLIAATAVVVSHSFALTGLREPFEDFGGGMTLGIVGVAAFFVTSGYLVAASAERYSPPEFLTRRARRLYPALAVSVAICLATGVLLTDLSSSQYLRSPGTWHFAMNVFALPAAYDLPGVFTDRPVSAINGNLWTLPFEVVCYAAALVIAKLPKSRRVALVTAWVAAMVLARWLEGADAGVPYLIERLAFLFRFFGAGMVLRAFGDRLPIRGHLAAVSVVALAVSPWLGLFPEALATFGAYALLVAALTAPKCFRDLTRRGDISYGVYLYSFPIQQMVALLALASPISWLANTLLALPLALAAGALSWVLVERRFVRRSPQLAVGTRRLPAA